MSAAPAPFLPPALGRPGAVLVAAPIPPPAAVILPRLDTTPRAPTPALRAGSVQDDSIRRNAAPDLAKAEVDGRRDAGGQRMAGRAALGFIGGLPVGFFGLIALGSREAGVLLPTAAGAVVVVAAAEAGATGPPEHLAETAAMHGPAYEAAYRDAYADRLRDRRRRFAFVGGGIGAAAGFGLLLLLLTQAGGR